MRHIIAGTAGHIDHGKTALVRALTGIDTDRLAEEKRRGISIDLGFAHLELEGGLRLGFVDVPGHERFVKNMLAGVGGIDLVLLVVAADESIKPQTREHFDICRLLEIPRGLVALTKADLVDRELLELVRLEVEEFVAGSFLEGAPIIPVSSVTGEGLAELRAALAQVASQAPPKDAAHHFRLPVDRAFTMRGFGAVVTGTLISGRVRLEEEVEAHPVGQRFRVRGIQVHGVAATEASAGQRTALNLAGGDTSRLARGVTLTAPGLFRPVQVADCLFQLLPSSRPLRHRAPVHFHSGTAEVIAEVRLLESGHELSPGSRSLVRFVFREPVLLLPGDRFIVRMFSPVVTIGGGKVVEIDPPLRLKRRESAERLQALASGTPGERLALLAGASPHGMALAELVARTGLTRTQIEAAARAAPLVLLREPEPWLMARAALAGLASRLQAALEEFHRANPLLAGMPREALRARELAGAPAFLLEAAVAAAGNIVAEGDLLRLAGHSIQLREEEAEALARIESAFEQAALAVPSTAEVLAQSGVEAARARTLLQMLLRQKRLIKVGDDLVFHAGAIERLRRLLAAHRGERFTVAQFKDWTGVSRKYAIPLLEYLDRERVTLRQGDTRVVV